MQYKLTADTKYGKPNPTPPNLIASTQSTVIKGAPTNDPSVFVNMTILKSWMSESGCAIKGDLTSDMVNTGNAEPRAYTIRAGDCQYLLLMVAYNFAYQQVTSRI